MLVRMWSNRNSHSLLVGIQNGTATLEDSLTVSYKTKHPLTIQLSNHAPWHTPGENHHSKRYMHSSVHCSTIYNSQYMEAT